MQNKMNTIFLFFPCAFECIRLSINGDSKVTFDKNCFAKLPECSNALSRVAAFGVDKE